MFARMRGGPPEQTGVLVIRVWTEGDAEAGSLRARITQTVDVSAPESAEKVAASPEEITSIVQEWLHAFVAGRGA
jgi:hypothetical protein